MHVLDMQTWHSLQYTYEGTEYIPYFLVSVNGSEAGSKRSVGCLLPVCTWKSHSIHFFSLKILHKHYSLCQSHANQRNKIH